MRDLGLPHDKVNVHGGACALGHPDRRLRGAHPRHAARRHGEVRRDKGVASLCIGGGEATAVAVERMA